MKRFTTILLLLLVLCPLAQARKIYLVSVGISDYPGEEDDLNLPEKDARAMFRLYTESANCEGILLTNDMATRSNIKERTRKLFDKAGADDIVIFFFSGHGYTGGDFVAYDGRLSYDDVKGLFTRCKSKNKMIFADACFAGKFRTSSSKTGNQASSATTQPKPSTVGSQVMLLLSSRGDEPSRESKYMRNGYFTACLLKCLKGAADTNGDRVVTAKELFIGVHKGVVELSRDRQHPVMWGKFSDDMPVFEWK